MVFRPIFLLVIVAPLLVATAARADSPADITSAGRAGYGDMVRAEAARQHLPPALADAVVTVESAYDARALGSSGEVGLMQVLPSTAAMLGFHGTLAELADPATNIHYGVTYLAGAWSMTNGRLCDTLMKYRAGYGETVMSLRSIIYCRRALDYLASLQSPLAQGPGTELPVITPAMLAADAAAGPAIRGRMPNFMTRAEVARMRAGHRTPADSARFWAAEEAYIRRLKARLATRHQVAAR